MNSSIDIKGFRIRMASNDNAAVLSDSELSAVHFDVHHARGHSATVARRIFDPKVMVRIHLTSDEQINDSSLVTQELEVLDLHETSNMHASDCIR